MLKIFKMSVTNRKANTIQEEIIAAAVSREQSPTKEAEENQKRTQ